MVYNRFGQLIFQSADPLKGWDGTVKGMRQDMGSFAWVCTYRLQGEASNTRVGCGYAIALTLGFSGIMVEGVT